MANILQFEGRNGGCLECEANLTDALDGTLSPADQASFDAHIASCATCSQMLSEAQRGQAWLEMLRTPRPEPSAALLDKIIAQTSGLGMPGRQGAVDSLNAIDDLEWNAPEWNGYALPVGLPIPSQPALAQAFVGPAGNVLPFRPTPTRLQALRYNLLQPRLAMTAAMAFFSVALTMNLTGVRLNQLHASDLGPSGIRRTFYDTTARAARYYGNLKVVYVMESRLEDIRRNREDDTLPTQPNSGPGKPAEPAPQLEQAPDQKPAKKSAPNQGTSRRETPGLLLNPAPHLERVATTSTNTSTYQLTSQWVPSPVAKPEHVLAEGE
jgi:hypothetical protein